MIDGKERIYSRLSLLLPDIDLLTWLDSQTLFPKFYWHSTEEFAALAAVETWDHPPEIQGDLSKKLRICGGRSFSETVDKDSLWKAFENTYFFLPMYELQKIEGGVELALNFLDTKASDENLRHIHFTEEKPLEKNLYQTRLDLTDLDSAKQSKIVSNEEDHSQIEKADEEKRFCKVAASLNRSNLAMSAIRWERREDLPSYPEWERIVHQFLEGGSCEKVVLARRTTLHFQSPLNPLSLLKDVRAKSRAKVTYAFVPSKEAAFIGASPERLYARIENKISCDVIAGTFIREEEIEDPKLQREFFYVKKAIFETLEPLCSALSLEPEDGIVMAYQIRHISNRVSGTLHYGVTDHHLIETLHPTPAIGGYPKEIACHFIAENEPFERGWYSAPIGFTSEHAAEFAVAIRSALVQEHQLHLFAGLGLVEGSKPQLEWEELELKIGQFL